MVAEACHWDEYIKLINLVTRLCGQVNCFHRSCDGNQWLDYTRTVKQLTQHFTPVIIGVEQSSLNYDRQQKRRESEDELKIRESLFTRLTNFQTLQGKTGLEDVSKSMMCTSHWN